MSKTRDMTVGKPASLIFCFALPLMLGNVCQQVYTMVDTAVVGRFVGVEALAALGAADWTNWLVFGLISGFTQGFSVLVAQRFGAGDHKGMQNAVASSLLLSGMLAVLLLVITQTLLRPTLHLLQTPETVFQGSETYLRICFLGIPVIVAYNMFASILRALGDGRTPLLAMLIASAINVALDLLFVVGFHWGIAGAASATVIAQAFSGLFCLRAIMRQPVLHIAKESWRPEPYDVRRLFALGMPMAFQNVIIAVGGMAVQYVINGYGFLFVAGFTATNKLYGILEVAATSYGFSVTTFAGQNLGAGKLDRVRRGTRSAAWMGAATALVITAGMLLFGKSILMLFLSGTPEEIAAVLQVAWKYLVIMSIPLVVLYMLHIYRSALIGLGDTVAPMISGFVEFCMRVGVAMLLPLLVGQDGIFYAEISAWCGAAVLLVLSYLRRMRLLEKNTLPSSSQEN